MLKINKINPENRNDAILDPQLLNLGKGGIMESFNWVANLVATILETFENSIGPEIKNDASGRMEPVAVMFVQATGKYL